MPTINDPNDNESRLASTKEKVRSLPEDDGRLVVYWLNNAIDDHALSQKQTTSAIF